MSSSRLTSSLYLLTFALLLQNVLGSIGQNNQDRQYGLVLCIGDVSSSDCRTCAVNATREIRKSGPDSRVAFIAYDGCLLKYSDKDFFGQIDDESKFYMSNGNNVSNPVVFTEKTIELLSQLATKASYNSTKLYAVGEMDLPEGSMKVYGMALCTRDLSSADCKKCLDGAIGGLPIAAYGKEWARAFGGSCMVIYQIHPFVTTCMNLDILPWLFGLACMHLD